MGIQALKNCQQRLMTITTIARARNRRTNVELLEDVRLVVERAAPSRTRSSSAARPGMADGASCKSRERTMASQTTTQADAGCTDDAERKPPAARRSGREVQHDDRSGDRAQRRSALDDAVAERPVTA